MTTWQGAPSLALCTPYYFSPDSRLSSSSRWASDMARALCGLERPWRVDLVCVARRRETLPICEGARLQLLGSDEKDDVDGALDALSWEMVGALEGSDVVVVNEPFTRFGEVAVLIAKGLGKPVVVVDGGARSSAIGASLGMLELVDELVCHHSFGQQLLPTPASARVVAPGTDHEWFVPGPSSSPRDQLLFVGRFHPAKGLDQLIESLPPELKLVACGSGPDGEYGELLHHLAEGKSVTFESCISDERLRDHYRRAWATVLPATYPDDDDGRKEPAVIAMAALESMACGTPVVVTDVGVLPEVVIDGSTGFVCSSIEELVARAVGLSKDPELVERMGAEGRKKVEHAFTLVGSAHRLGSLLEEVASRDPHTM